MSDPGAAGLPVGAAVMNQHPSISETRKGGQGQTYTFGKGQAAKEQIPMDAASIWRERIVIERDEWCRHGELAFPFFAMLTLDGKGAMKDVSTYFALL